MKLCRTCAGALVFGLLAILCQLLDPGLLCNDLRRMHRRVVLPDRPRADRTGDLVNVALYGYGRNHEDPPTGTVPYDMRRKTFAWAAGLFEGEGSVGLSMRKWQGGKDKRLVYRHPRCQLKLAMTDRDVVATFAKVMGCGIVYQRRRPPMRDGCVRKTMWEWFVGSKLEVAYVIRLLEPWMHQRRRHRMRAARRAMASVGLLRRCRIHRVRRVRWAEGWSK